MKRLLLALALAAMGGGAAGQPPASVARGLDADAEREADAATSRERRILVMLRMPPEHYRPGSDYGSAGGYGDPAAALARRRLAARIAKTEKLVLVDTWPMPILGIDCAIMSAPGDEPIAAVVERVSRVKGVAWSQPLNRFETRAATPHNDRLFAAQPSAHAWRLAELHRVATGRGVKVAVIDSMIEVDHPDLRGRVAISRDFVGGAASPAERHGTGVAGIIGARANNHIGIAGIAPATRLVALRACWQRASAKTVCDSLTLARALIFAIENGADVINLSLTGPRDLLVARLIAIGVKRGSAIVAAVDPHTSGGFPATLPGVIAVSQDGLAADRRGVYNAPGRDVPTTEPGGRWYLVSGNSYAAAHVSGLLALVREMERGTGGRTLVAARGDGGTIDACGTLRLAARRPASRCGGAR